MELFFSFERRDTKHLPAMCQTYLVQSFFRQILVIENFIEISSQQNTQKMLNSFSVAVFIK